MSENRVLQPNLAFAAAGAWLVVMLAWGLSNLFGSWDGDGFSVLGVLGWAALIAAGVLMLLTMLKVDAMPHRTWLYRAGIVALGLGTLVSIPMFWAVPVWSSLYAIAMVLFSISTRRERIGSMVIAAGMAAGVLSLVVLTALEVGTPDPTYGDYPIAWATAFSVAAAGGAVGSFLLGRAEEPSVRSTSEHELSTV
jgi:hypothetical protein